jgi:hypothetical protein
MARTDGSLAYGIATLTVWCDTGDVVFSGGCWTNSSGAVLVDSFPINSGGVLTDIPDGWRCKYDVTVASVPGNIHAVCLDL